MRPKEQPRRVGFAELLGLVQRAAKLFATLGGGSRPGVAYMLPSLAEAHATLWGAEAIGYAVPINFLLQPDAVAGLLEACGARILVALGPHPALDLAEGPGAARARARAGSAARGPARHAAGRRRAGLPHRRLHRPPPKLVTHTHRSQIASAFGGAALGDTRATEDELHEHAQRTIAERPAWPKQIHLVDAIALTSVGKIHKPQLRCDAAAHLVTRLVREQLALPRAQVQASEGGKRGMVVRVGPAGVLAETRMQHHRGQLVPCTPGVCRCCNAR